MLGKGNWDRTQKKGREWRKTRRKEHGNVGGETFDYRVREETARRKREKRPSRSPGKKRGRKRTNAPVPWPEKGEGRPSFE